MCACLCWMVFCPAPPPSPVPLSCSSLMSQGWLIWPWAATLARQERELPRLRAPLNWICKTKKKPSRGLIDISVPLPPPHLFSPFLLSSFIQSTPLLICSPWWEEIYQDAVSLTSLSDWDRNRISKCLNSLRGFIFKLPPPPPPYTASCTSKVSFQEKGVALCSTPVWWDEMTIHSRGVVYRQGNFSSSLDVRHTVTCSFKTNITASVPRMSVGLLANQFSDLERGWRLGASVLTGWWWPAGSQWRPLIFQSKHHSS